MRTFAWIVAVASSLCAAGCTSTGHPPTARVTPAPAYLPLDDAYHTDLLLDGSASRNDIDDPEGLSPLLYHWEIDDPAPVIVSGGLDAAMVTVRLAATSPTTVRLTVTDGAGDASTTTLRIGVTIPN